MFLTTCILFSPAQSEFEQECLEAHNKYRAIHDVPPMTMNAEMNSQAAEWAEQIASLGEMKHAGKEKRNGHGENLYFSSGMDSSGGDVVTSW